MSVRERGLVARLFTLQVVFLALWPESSLGESRGPIVSPTPYDHIRLCLSLGNEVVLSKRRIDCVPYRQAVRYLEARAPLDLDPQDICEDITDWRRLSGDTIKRLTTDKVRPVAPSGIRILGAVYCDQVDLVGLDLKHSIVLDYSVFRNGIEARNLRIQGDFSVDHSIVLNTLRLVRARIDGSVFGDRSYVNVLRVFDTEVRGSMLLRDGLVGRALFDGMTLSGELTVRGTALSHLYLHVSKIGGAFDLSESEARCAYHIKKSDIGEVTAIDFGLGKVDVSTAGARVTSWNRALRPRGPADALQPSDAHLLLHSTPVVQSKEVQPGCDATDQSFGFVLFDNRIRTSLCLERFHWVTPSVSHPAPASSIIVNHTRVTNNVIINLWPRMRNAIASAPGDRVLESVGLKAGGLILNFNDSNKPFSTFIDGMQFERVYAADRTCAYESAETSHHSAFISERGLRTPNVEDVTAWLKKNQARSIQPYTAFIDAFDRAGDNSKPLRIARANWEFESERTPPATAAFSLASDDPPHTGSTDGSAKNRLAAIGTFIDSMFGYIRAFVADCLTAIRNSIYFAFRHIWAFVADHGYAPIKAVPWIAGLIICYGLYFWFFLGIVGFKPEKKETVRPIGLLFLFDRLIPLYNLRQDHYNIVGFYRRASGRVPPDGQPPMRYLWFSVPVEEADESQVRRVEGSLDLLKVMGVVLAVFLAAAINALVAR